MKYVVIFVIVSILGAILWLVFPGYIGKSDQGEEKLGNTSKEEVYVKKENIMMNLKSTAFENDGIIPSKYTCDGLNINPPLSFSNIPEDAKSLILIMDDKDVPKNIRSDGVWDHWVVFNIPTTTISIKEGEKVAGLYGVNTGGAKKYTGPCPPDREHRYNFYLYAIDKMLTLNEGATKSNVLDAIKDHIISEARLIGRYDRDR